MSEELEDIDKKVRGKKRQPPLLIVTADDKEYRLYTLREVGYFINFLKKAGHDF